MKNFKEALEAVKNFPPLTLAVSGAADDNVLLSVVAATHEGIVTPVLFGSARDIKHILSRIGFDLAKVKIVDVPDENESITAAARAVADGRADILMKGQVHSGSFLKTVLKPEYGLRKENRSITAIAILESEGRLLFITDLGFIPAPDLEMKKNILQNAVEVAHALGIENPKAAPLCASETYSPKIPSTVDAKALEQMNLSGEITGCTVAGPISLDLAVSEASARHKAYEHPVAGKADILLMPSIEAGNILYKSLTYFAHLKTGGVMAGSRKPIVFMSRSDDAETKLNTIILAAYLARKGGGVQ